jgi:transposase
VSTPGTETQRELTKEQVMVADDMNGKGVSIRQLAKQFGVRESALRYRLRRRREGATDGRTRKSAALDAFEEAVHVVLERLGDVRLTGDGQPAQARQVYDVLRRDHGFTGSYKSVVRLIQRQYGAAPVRALRRVETPPGVQAQHDWFEVLHGQ